MSPISRLFAVSVFLFFSVGVFGQSEPKDTLSKSEQLILEGENFRKENEFEAALEKFETAAAQSFFEKDYKTFEKAHRWIQNIYILHEPKERLADYQEKLRFCIEEFGERSDQSALWHFYIGRWHETNYHWQKAEEAFEKSISIFRLYDDRTDDLYGCYEHLGIVMCNIGSFERGEEYFSKCEALLPTLYTSGNKKEFDYDMSFGYLKSNLGIISKEKGDYSKAVQLLKEGLDKFVKHEIEEEIGKTYYNIGFAYLLMGQYIESDEYLNKALSLMKKKFGEQHYFVAATYNLLGNLYRNTGKISAAIHSYQKNLAIQKATFGEEHPRVGITEGNLAQLYLDLDSLDIAKIMAENALRKFEKSSPEPNNQKTQAYKSLAMIWEKRPNQIDSTLFYFGKALD